MKASSFPFLSHDFPPHRAGQAREHWDCAARRHRVVFSCLCVETESLVSSFPLAVFAAQAPLRLFFLYWSLESRRLPWGGLDACLPLVAAPNVRCWPLLR